MIYKCQGLCGLTSRFTERTVEVRSLDRTYTVRECPVCYWRIWLMGSEQVAQSVRQRERIRWVEYSAERQGGWTEQEYNRVAV